MDSLGSENTPPLASGNGIEPLASTFDRSSPDGDSSKMCGVVEALPDDMNKRSKHQR
jgi:hypothetical protein